MAKCCFDYVWWEQFLGQFQGSTDSCALNYIIGDQNTFGFGGTLDKIYLNGNPYVIGIDYTDVNSCRAAITAAISSECGGAASEAGYAWTTSVPNLFYVGVESSSGCVLTQIDYTDDFATPQSSSVVKSITCVTSCLNTTITTDAGGGEAISLLTIDGYDYTFSGDLNTPATLEPGLTSFLQNMGFNVDLVTAKVLGGGKYTLEVISSAPISQVTWISSTPASGTSNMASC